MLANLGAAYGTAKSGVGIANLGIMRPDMVMRSLIPVVMAGVLGIYGLITAVIINGKIHGPSYSSYSGYAHLAAPRRQYIGRLHDAWMMVDHL